MTQEMMIMAAILVAVILLTFIGILSRYRKCKSDEVLVVYGKTGGDKKSANVKLLKLYLAIENTLYLCIKDKINNEKSYRLYSCFY